jgi:hypothetical protein
MGQTLEWDKPDPESSYNEVYIYRATSEAGVYTNIAVQAVTDNTYFDINGVPSSWYKIRFYDSAQVIFSDYSLPMQAGDSEGYITVADVRDQLKIDEPEWADEQIQKMINNATKAVDDATGRTWMGAQSVSNEYFDGQGKLFFDTGHADLQSITALAVRTEGSSTFTTVTTSYVHVYDDGRIQLDLEAFPGCEVSVFPLGFKNIRLSYVYGVNSPTEDVRMLTLLMLAQMIQIDPQRKEMIDSLVDKLKFNSPSMV